jgi:hypothetical protein
VISQRSRVPPCVGIMTVSSPVIACALIKNLTPCNTYVLLLFVSDPTAMTERHAAILARLAEVGERLAMKHAERALAADDLDVEAKATVAFHRAARSVRQCLALEAKLIRDAARADRDDAQREATAQREALSVSDHWRSIRRRREVKEIVAHTIETEAGEFDAEQLFDDLEERLAAGDEDADFADRPIGELVARICRDLGIAPDWSLFEDEDWAIEEARDKPPGSPYAAGPIAVGASAPPPDPELRSSA